MEKILNDVRRDAIKKLRMSDKNVEILAEAADRIMICTRKVYRYGFLSLESGAKDTDSEMLRLTTMLLVHACTFEEIVEEATATYWATQPEGVWAMADYIYLRGVLMLSHGLAPDQHVAPMLQSLIPKDQRSEFKKRMRSKAQHRKEIFDKYTQIQQPVLRNADLSEKIQALKRVLSQGIWEWTREICDMEVDDLAVCIYVMDPEIREDMVDVLSRLRSAKCMLSILEGIVRYHQTKHDGTDMEKSISAMLSSLT